ncbi:MAG: filamentous hemagglutinin N-terminal domain-containing protein, partial [Rhodoferax sp.]
MSAHASMNRIFRLVWNEVLGIWVAVSEISRGRGKRSVRAGVLLAPLLAALGLSLPAHAGPPGAVPADTQLPTGGVVTAGAAVINPGTVPGSAVLNIDQSSQRAAIDWNTFNLGSAAQVNFNQPNSSSATLNRVLDTNPSQIFGKITAPGQVFLSNPNGVHFGKSASVDVGSLTATTHGISNADFMAGKATFARNGATGSVVNEGELRAALGGYIALLAPEVRNEGVIIAQLGTVAMASGESITLNFDGNNTLASLTVQPSAIRALVENKGAVLAPGGLIVLSARALDRLQGGVVKNTGRLEATGLSLKGGRIVLEASDRIENTGTISANAGADGSPAGSITMSAPEIVNSGIVSAVSVQTVAEPPSSGGSIALTATNIVQTDRGALDVSGPNGGSITLQAGQNITLGGNIAAESVSEGQGGSVAIVAADNVTVQDAAISTSGTAAGGTIRIDGGTQAPVNTPLAPEAPDHHPTVALLGSTQLRSSSRRGQGGSVTLTADHVGLFDGTAIDVSGATGGGFVLVGGDYQGKNPDIANASATYVGSNTTIHADATENGEGGKVIVWADGATRFLGHISAQGGARGGDGGFAEVSGKGVLDFLGTVDLKAPMGEAGMLLLDPYNLTISTGSDTNVSGATPFDATGTGSILSVTTLQNALASGNVTVTTGSSGAESGDITVANDIGWFSTYTLTLAAYRNIDINASVYAFNGNLTLTAGTGGASGAITLANSKQINLLGGNLVASAYGDIIEAAGVTQGYIQVASTSSFSSSHGSVTLGAVDNKLSGAVSITSGDAGSISFYNNQATLLGTVTGTGTGGVNITSNGHLTGSSALHSAGTASLTTKAGSAGNITLTGGISSVGAVSISADGVGGASLADLNGNLTFAAVSAGGAITLGNDGTGAITFDSTSGNVISGNAGAGGQASGIVTVKGTSITINDAIRTKGGNISLTATTGAVTANTGANITTTADTDTGTASGTVTVTAANTITLQDTTTTGASNSLGVGSNAAAVTLSASAGDINVGAITTTGGAATAGATTNRNGGNAGSILIGATSGTNINLNGDLNAIGGGYVGAATQGLGGYIELTTPVVLTANRVVSSGATSGNISFLSTINSDGTSRSLTVTAGTGDVLFDGTVGGLAVLSSLAVSSSARADIEENVTTNAASGVSVVASSQIRLGDDDVANGSGAMTIHTLAGNGTVNLTTPSVYLDDAITLTRGTGAISISQSLYSKNTERNNLTFNGAGGGAIAVSQDVGGTGASDATKLGDILVSTGTDLTVGRYITAKSLTALNNTGQLSVGSSTYSQYYDGAIGLQLATTGLANNYSNDQNITLNSNVVLAQASAPIYVSAPNGAIGFYSDANLTTAGGEILLNAGAGALTLGATTDMTSNGGLMTLTGVGVTQSLTDSVLNAGSGKIRVDGGGSAVQLYGRLLTTNADTLNTPAVLITHAGGGGNAVSLRSLEAQTGTWQVGLVAGTGAIGFAQTLSGAGAVQLVSANLRLRTAHTVTLTSAGNDSTVGFTVTGTDAAGNPLVENIAGANVGTVTTTGVFKTITSITANSATASTVSAGLATDDAVNGALYQYVPNWSLDEIDIKTLSAATTAAITVTSTNNIIDQLGSFSVGSSLDVRAKGRTAGMALTGNVSATTVTLMTGNGALVLGSRNITSTAGDVLLQGKGVTQGAGSAVTATGFVTIWGSDYANLGLRGDVTMAGSIVSASTNASAVTLADLNALTLPNITIGSSGARGGLRLGNHEHNGAAYRRAYGVIGQTAGTQLKIGALDIRQNSGSGVVDLSLVNNEILSVGYVERGGAITIYDKDSEVNGLSLTSIYDGSYDTLLKATTEGAMTLSGTNRGKGMELTAGAAGFTGSGSIEGHYGGAGIVKITATGALALTSGTMYAKGVQLTSGAGGITSAVDIQSHHSGGGDIILDGGGGNITLTNRLYNDGVGNDIFVQSANNVQLQRVEVYSTGRLILGGSLTTPGTALTGNVTQTSYITANSDGVNLIGSVAGSVTLNNTNQIYRIGAFTSGGNFSIYNQDRTLVVEGALLSTGGDISVESRRALTVSSTGTVTASNVSKGVTLKASSGEWGYTATIQGAVSAGTGGISLTSPYGYVSTSGAGTLTTTGALTISSAPNYSSGGTDYSTTVNAAVSAGASGITINSAGTFSNNATGTLTSSGLVAIKTYWDGTNNRNLTLGGAVAAGANGIKLTSSGTINQTGGILTTTGTLSGPNQSGATSLTNDTPSARGAITLNQDNEIGSLGPFYLYNASAAAFSLRDISGGLTLAGTIENSHGAITISTVGAALDLATNNVYAGGQASGGANIALTGRGILQSPGTINATGGALNLPRSGTSGGTITLTGHDGTQAGLMTLLGTIQTASNSTSAVMIRGTSNLALPSITASNGSLLLGDDTATIGQIAGNITQSNGTALDIKTLNLGTATNAISGSAVLANAGNKIVQLATVKVGDVVGTQYDLDIYDSTSGLNLTQNLTSAGGIRLRTTTGDGATGTLALGANSVLAAGDIFLGGQGVSQLSASVVNADNAGAGGTGGSIRIDGGGGAYNIAVSGTLTTDNAGASAIEIVNATNATLNVISATAGTVSLGMDGLELTGTVSQTPTTGVISATTLKGDAGVVTLNLSNINNLGTFTTSGAMTLKDQGGTGTAGLKFTGTVIVGSTTEIQSTDGVLDLDVQTLNATGQAITLRGLGVEQESSSSILSSTAAIYGGAANIDLFSALNNFTGQVTVNTTGSQVRIQDANQLSMNALTNELAASTSITAWAGTTLVLATENITTSSGNIEFRSLDGNLSTPGNLTTTTGNIALHANTTTNTGDVQVNNTIITGSGNVQVNAEEEVILSKSIVSTSGNIGVVGATVTHSTGSSGSPLQLQTGSAGTISMTASGGNGLVMGQYFSYQSDAGAITIVSGGTADLSNISTNGTLSVNAVGAVEQVGSGSVLAADSMAVTTAGNGSITLTNASNDVNKLKLISRNVANDGVGSGTITYGDADDVAVSQIETSGAANLTAKAAISTDITFGTGAVVADTLTVKSLNNSGAAIVLTAAGNDVNTLVLKVRNAADTAKVGAATISRFTDSDTLVISSIETAGSMVLAAGNAVTQSGAIIADKLGLSGVGTFTLNATSSGIPLNEVSTFASDATGAVNFSSKLGLSIGAVNPTGITTGGASITLTAPSIDSSGQTIDTRSTSNGTAGGAVILSTTGTAADGNLSVGGIVTSGTDATASSGTNGGAAGNITLTTAGNTLTVAGTVAARGGAGDGVGVRGADGTVKLLAAAGAVVQANGTNEITAGKLLISALNTSSLLDTGNAVDLVAAKITGEDKNFTYRSGANFGVGGGESGIIGITTQGGDIDIGASDVNVSVDEAISTRGGAFSATAVRSFNSAGVTISTLGDVTFGAGAYKNGGAISINTTANSGAVNTGTLVSSGDATAAEAVAGSITLLAHGILSIASTTAQGVGIGAGGAVSVTGSEIRIGGAVDTSSTGAAGGTISVNGPAVLLGGDRVMSTGAGLGDITFSGTLNSDGVGTPRGLTLTSGTGDITFSGSVGANAALGALNIVSADAVTAGVMTAASLTQQVGAITTLGGVVSLSGNLDFNGNVLNVNAAINAGGTVEISNAGVFATAAAGDITAVGGFTQNGVGANELAGDIATTNSQIAFATSVTLKGDVAMGTDTGIGNIVFAAGVDSDTTARDLSLTSGTGNVTFTGLVGASRALDVLTVNSSGLSKFSAAVTAASVTTDAPGTVQINGGSVTTSGAQTYNDALTLGDNTTLTASTMTSNGTLAGASHSLSIVGNAVFGNDATDAVSNLTTLSVSGTTVINTSAITSTGTQSYTGAVNVGNDSTLTTTDSALVFASTVNSEATEANDLSVAAGTGSITFTGVVGGALNGALGALALNSSGTTLLNAAVTAASVATDAPGTVQINGGSVTTTGAQTYNDAITLGDNTTLTASTMTSNGTLAGASHSLSIVGNAVFGNDANDAVSNLTTLSVSGTTAINTSAISSAGTQSYTGAVTLGADASLTSGNAISFASTVDSDADITPRSLRLTSATASGQNFVAAIGGTHSLDILRIESAGVVTQSGSAPIKAAKLAIKSAGAVTLTHAGNDVDILAALMSGNASLTFVDGDGLTIGSVDSAALQIVGISDGAGISSVTLTVGGLLNQSVNASITLDGNLTIDTTAFNADDVALKNTAAAGTVLDNSLVSGDFTLYSTGNVTQRPDANGSGADAYLQIGGNFDLTGAGQFIQGNSSNNLIGGGSAGTANNEIRLYGVITLSMNGNGDLVASANNGTTTSSASILSANLSSGVVVTSDAGGKSISAVANGTAISLNDANNIGGLVKITTKGTYSNSGTAVATGILQSTDLNLAAASFFVQQSTSNTGSVIAGAGKLNLSNAGNTFTGAVSATAIGMDAHLREDTNLQLGTVNAGNVIVELDTDTSALNITQVSGTTLSTNTLLLRNSNGVTLANANRVGTLAAKLNGALAFTNNQALTVGTASLVDGITTNNGNVVLKTTTGNLVLQKAITVPGAANITLASAGNFINNVGANALEIGTGILADSGIWQVWSTSPLLDTAGGLSPDYKQYNATYGTTTVLGTGNGLHYTLAPELTVALTGALERTYNGTDTASLTQSNYNVTSGLLSGDAVVFSTAGTFDNKNVGNAKTVRVNPLSIVSASANSGAVPIYGYQLDAGSGNITGAIGKITKADLAVSTSNVTKTYSGTTSALGTAVVAAGSGTQLFGSDSISGGTFAFLNRNAGTGDKVVSTVDVAVADGNSGGNYNVSYVNNTTSTINKATLTVKTSDVSKTYNGSLAVAGTAVAVSGLGVGDSLSGGTFAFTNANAGSNKTVTAAGVTVNDGNTGGNYNALVYVDNTTSTIDKANLTVSTIDVTKSYEGTLSASGTATVTSGTLYTNANNSTLDSLSGGSFAFTNANVGSGNKTVTTAAVTVNDGNSGGNYNVSYANNTT